MVSQSDESNKRGEHSSRRLKRPQQSSEDFVCSSHLDKQRPHCGGFKSKNSTSEEKQSIGQNKAHFENIFMYAQGLNLDMLLPYAWPS